MKIVKRTQVIIDVIETVDFISQNDLEIAHKFIDVFENKISALKKTEAQPNFDNDIKK